MYIEEIKWSSTPPSEADIIVSDGTYKVTGFAYGSEYKKGDVIRNPLHVFEPTGIIRAENSEFSIIKDTNPLGYEICGLLIEKDLLRVGDLLLQIYGDLIPKDISIGEFISFNCARLDLW